jgi:predicted RNA-binding Zn ribbon-like protein
MSASRASVDHPALSARLCLDFSNTLEWHASDHPQESLTSYADLVNWSLKAGVVTNSEARLLLREARRRPAEASAALERAIFLREAIYRIFSSVAAKRRPKKADLDTLNDALSEALARARVVQTGEGFVWDWAGRGSALEGILWPVVRSAAELLTSGDLGRVRECAGVGCGWLFVDVSRNRLRRWCDMKSCGNRAKARRHYERIKAAR